MSSACILHFEASSLTSATEFAQGKVDPVEAGKQGGSASGGSSESTGSSGSAKGEFAHGKVDPVEAGKKGGATSS